MSEPRKLNTGDAQRTVYHADGSAPRNIQTDAAANRMRKPAARPAPRRLPAAAAPAASTVSGRRMSPSTRRSAR